MREIRFTPYARDALARRPEIRLEFIERVVANPYRFVLQPDGRRRFWGYILEAGKWLRVIVLEDGSIHNAFFDRGFRP